MSFEELSPHCLGLCLHFPLQQVTENSHSPSGSTRMKSLATAAADFQHPLKGVLAGDQEGGPLCSGKNWQNRPSES